MNKRIDDAYNEHMQQSSPDMDMLWARIENRIDASQKASDKQNVPQITQSSPAPKRTGIAKYIALAACLVAVVAGTVVFMTSKENEVKSDTTISAKGDVSSQKAKKTNNAVADEREKKNEEDFIKDGISKAEITNDKKTETKTLGGALDPEKSMRELKQTDEYIAADFEHRIEMLTGLAEKMKSQSVITQYQVKRKNTNSRLEMTLPDGTLIMILL